MFDFTNKIVMVTGASGNLGFVLAMAFQASRAKLALVDRGKEKLQQLYPDFINSPDYLMVNCADLMDEGAVEASVSEIIQYFNRIDVLVNTVGGSEIIQYFNRIDVLVNTVGGFQAGKMLHETPIETWDFLLKLNARSVFIACHKVIPHMLNQGSGKIINVAARPGITGQAGMSAYSASKSAVMRLTESMAAELKDQKVNVNCIIPGTIDTKQNREAMPEADFSTWVAPESLADVILFLSSEAARDIHGVALPVYGRS
jgi:NAD(P)-dependent dehydrogenase (short-subunit alcohol dehydrogenase family)